MFARLAGVWRYLLVALCLAAAPVLAQQQFQPTGPYTHAPSGLVFPESMGGMQRAMAIDYEPQSPGLGVSVKYIAGGGMFADVYVFNAGQRQIATGITDPLVQRMLDAAVRDIHGMGKAGRYLEVKPTGNQVVSLGKPGSGAAQALVASFSYVLSGTEVYSQVYGLAAHNHFVKVRVTYPQDQSLQSIATLGTFLEELGTVVGNGAH